VNAGRELDALVAEKVMGLTVIRTPFVPRDVTPRGTHFTDEAVTEWRRTYPNSVEVNRVSRYSTDMTAAWQMVGRLKELNHVMHLHEYPESIDIPIGASCAFGHWPSKQYTPSLDADTAPHAICLAALKALGRKAT
jgi:hypothetical protein